MKYKISVVLFILLLVVALVSCSENRKEIPDSEPGFTDVTNGDTDKDTVNPPVFPTKGNHPRVMVNDFNLNKIISSIDDPSNKGAREQYEMLSQMEITGKLSTELNSYGTNADRTVLCAIESKAFRYLITGEEKYGYQAITAVKNAILTVKVDRGDNYRDYGLLMYVSACVYDWCYDLLTAKDMEQIATGAINFLGRKFEIGWPPVKRGDISHHNVECQLLRSYLSLAIAVYDEYPSIYECVAGRIYNGIVPAQNFMLQSSRHWEGSGYGPSRTYYLLWGQYLISAMTQGEDELFNSDDLQRVCNTFIHFIYPGQKTGHPAFEIGDQCNQSLADYYIMAFMAGNYFKDYGLLDYGQQEYTRGKVIGIPGFHGFSWITPVTYIIMNDTGLQSDVSDNENHDWSSGRPLVEMTDFPGSSIFARSSWNDSDAVAVYMNMNEYYSSSHSHMELGSFQIYYKGILISDSGIYDGYGSKHHFGYSIQTISSNSILVYNSDAAKSLDRYSFPYSGGQSLVLDNSRRRCSYTLEDALKCKSMNQCKILGKCFEADDKNYNFSYIAGDMTKAYDSKTVDEVTRYMISVMTDEPEYPMLFLTYDRVTAKNAKYKKTYLLHCKQEPAYSNGFLVINNTKGRNSGRLVAQFTGTEIGSPKILGGSGNEYNVNGKPIIPNGYSNYKAEYRIEISPSVSSLTDSLLTCMYVTDAENKAPFIKAESISTDYFEGVVLLNRAILFPKEQENLSGTFEFSVEGTEQIDYYIAGVCPGEWKVTVGEKIFYVKSDEGDGIIHFTADAGNIQIRNVG